METEEAAMMNQSFKIFRAWCKNTTHIAVVSEGEECVTKNEMGNACGHIWRREKMLTGFWFGNPQG
jgi:hypothetical protein